MNLYLVVASLFSVIIVAVAALTRKVSLMSASTDSLAAAVAALATEVTAVSAAVAALKVTAVSAADAALKAQPKQDPADTAALDKAVADVQAATAALAASVA